MKRLLEFSYYLSLGAFLATLIVSLVGYPIYGYAAVAATLSWCVWTCAAALVLCVLHGALEPEERRSAWTIAAYAAVYLCALVGSWRYPSDELRAAMDARAPQSSTDVEAE